MGFYSSRPELKQRPTRIARTLVLAEKLSALEPPDPLIEASLQRGWSSLVLMNHHDAITGTSTDRVCREQRAWLDVAEAAAASALARACAPPLATLPTLPTLPADRAPHPVRHGRSSRHANRWWRDGPIFHVRTAHHTLVFSEELGGCLTSLEALGREQLGGLGLDLVAFADEGGLWRLGHEYRGGGFELVERASHRPARIAVTSSDDVIRVVITSQLQRKPFTRTVTCRRGDRFLRVEVSGAAARRRSVVCRVEVAEDPVALEMDTIGGFIERPRERTHQPTFWPVPSMISLVGTSQALHASFEAPTAVSLSPQHALEWMVARNAVKERAFGMLPVLAHPIGGTGDERQTHHAALFVTHEPTLSAAMRRELEVSWFPEDQQKLKHLARKLVQCDDPQVWFPAVKRAESGDGIVVRLCCERGSASRAPARLWVPSRQVRAAHACDALERDLGPLEIEEGRAVVPLGSRLTSVRLVLG
jgi:hypothetical protein